MQDWRRLSAEEKLSDGQKNWFKVPKPIEELYDTAKDPWELNNLAELPQYTERLARMRRSTQIWQQEIGDMGLIPEAVMMEEMKPDGRTPVTQAPKIDIDGGFVSLRCETDGASIVYQMQIDGGWGPWQLYTRSFADPATAFRVQGSRLGYENSKIVTHSSPLERLQRR
jgi:hypothetical protein